MWPILGAVLWVVLTLTIGRLVTNLGPWYRALVKPPWQPPDWLFGPAWTVIFVCAATAAVFAWNAPSATVPTHITLIAAYLTNSALNIAWSVVFFAVKRPDLALIEVSALWVSILLMMLSVGSVAPSATWLLLPYLLWVSFASVLNFSITRLNR